MSLRPPTELPLSINSFQINSNKTYVASPPDTSLNATSYLVPLMTYAGLNPLYSTVGGGGGGTPTQIAQAGASVACNTAGNIIANTDRYGTINLTSDGDMGLAVQSGQFTINNLTSGGLNRLVIESGGNTYLQAGNAKINLDYGTGTTTFNDKLNVDTTGEVLTFPQLTGSNVGQIVGISTINGAPYTSGSGSIVSTFNDLYTSSFQASTINANNIIASTLSASTVSINSGGAIQFTDSAGIEELTSINGNLYYNGQLLAKAGDITAISDWSLYAQISTIDSNNNNIININNISSQNTFTSSLTVSSINGVAFPQSVTDISTLTGEQCFITGNAGVNAIPGRVSITGVNGTGGVVDILADVGVGSVSGGAVNVEAKGGTLYGAVYIKAQPGTSGSVTTGGLVDIRAYTGTSAGALTSAIKLNAGGIVSQAGFTTTIGSLEGYNFVGGNLGVNICAGSPSIIPNVPGTCYIYGTTGIELNSDVYTTRVYPYWDGNLPPSNLSISGRTTVIGSASVLLNNVATIGMEGAGTITGVNFINGAAYPPPASGVTAFNGLTGNVTLSPGTNITLGAVGNTITINSTGTTPTSITQGGASVACDPDGNITATTNGGGQTMNLTSDGNMSLTVASGLLSINNLSSGDICKVELDTLASINLQARDTTIKMDAPSGIITFNNKLNIDATGEILTFPQVASVNVGQIVGISTINGSVFPSPTFTPFVEAYQIYVASNGNNTTGTGSQQNPYLTIAQAIIKRATLSFAVECSIILSSGTYIETFTLGANTFLVGLSTGEQDQPCNVVGQIILNASSGQVGLSGLQISLTSGTDAVLISGASAVYSIYNCNITGGTSNGVNISQGTVYITDCRIYSNNTTGAVNPAIAIGSGAVVTIRNSTVTNQINNPSAVITCNGTLTVRQCVFQSLNTASTTLQALVVFSSSGGKSIEFSNCNLTYANTLIDTVGNKCCVQFQNATGTYTVIMTNCVLLCEGAITAVGGQIQCIQKPGAGIVTMSYGNLLSGATANHIAPTITHVALTPVT